jgi:molybdenum cofactor biosynthesis protein A
MPEEGIPLRPKAHFMSQEEVVHIAQTFCNLGISKIRLTGGEPLIRKDFGEIIQKLSLLPVELAITTNGILIDQYVETFRACGVRTFNVSLDTLQQEKMSQITRRDYYHRIMSNIDLLLKDPDNRIKINAVLIKGVNDDELIDFIEFTKNRQVSVRFIEYMPFSGNKWDWEKGVGIDKIITELEESYGGKLIRILDKKHDTARNYKISGYQGSFGIISSVTNPFCDTCNRIRLTADGKIKNCLFSSGETDLLTSLRNGEDIEQLIRYSIWEKKQARGGMTSFDDFSNPEKNQKNRTMTAIGG